MKSLLLLFSILFLAGCNALGGIPPETVNAIASAGGGCVKVSGVWGNGIVMVGSAEKGVIRNGEVTIAGECSGIAIKDAATVRQSPLPPGSVTTITVPSSTTTTVTPAPKP